MKMENPPFEDVFPIEHWEKNNVSPEFSGVYFQLKQWVFIVMLRGPP